MKNFLIKSLPHVAAVVVFVIISSVYFSPYFDGYELEQSDISQFLGMSKEIADYEALTGEHVQWTNQLFGGMPAYQISPDNSGNWIKSLEYILKLGLPRPVGILFMAMLGFYILAQCVRANPWVSLLGGVAFGLASINILYIGAGHMAKVNAIAYMAPVLGGVLLTMRGKLWLGAGVTTLFLALHLTANHLQMTYYLVFLILFAGIAEGVKLILNKQITQLWKSAAVLIVAAGIAFLPSASSILNTYEYSQHTTRGENLLTIGPDGNPLLGSESGLDKDYILEYSMGRGEVFSLMIPNIKGGMSGIMGEKANDIDAEQSVQQLVSYGLSYWGRQASTGGAFYFGIITVLLFILGMVIVKDHLKWGLLVVALMAIILSWRDATGLTDFFIDSVPGFAKFRDTKMMLVLVQVIMPFMAVLALDELVKSRKEIVRFRKPVLITAGAFGVIVLLIAATPQSFFDFDNPKDEAHYAQLLTSSGFEDQAQIQELTDLAMDELIPLRMQVVKDDALRGFLFFLGAFALLFAMTRGWLKYQHMVPILGILILADMYMVDQRYLNNEKVTSKERGMYPNKKAGDYLRYVKSYDKYYPFTASLADLQILEREKPRFDDFQDHADRIYKERLSFFDKTPRNKDQIKSASEFGALSLLSDYRVLTIISQGGMMNPTQDGRTSYFHKSLGGYHGAKLMRYQDIISFHLGQEMNEFVQSVNTLGPNEAVKGLGVINMLNTRYLGIGEDRPAIFNTAANGNAWFVDEVVAAETNDDEIIRVGQIDTKTAAVVHADFADMLPASVAADTTGYIALETYSPERLTYISSASSEQLAVFSEVYYPEDWQAYIDGEAVDHFRVNYLLRGLRVPAGEHEIEFVFTSSRKSWLAMLGSILVLLLFFGAAYKELRPQLTAESV